MSDEKSTAQWIRDNHTTQMYHDWITDVPDSDALPSEILALHAEGPWRVVVKEVSLGDPAAQLSMPDGHFATIGISLRQLREQFGGDEGFLHDPVAGKVPISLAKWKSRDPDTTFIQISMISRPAR